MKAWLTVLSFHHVLLTGFLVTVELSVIMIVGGLILGAIAAVGLTVKGKSLPIRIIRRVVRIYVELFRGSPLLLQLFFGYYGISYTGVNIDIISACGIVLVLYAGSYICEIVRSGIESIPKGQFEAGCSVGLSYVDIMRFVIFPQAFKIFLPTLVGCFISLIKDTSVVSLIGCTDVFIAAKVVINKTALPIQTYLLIALAFFVICYPLSLLVRRLEKRRAY